MLNCDCIKLFINKTRIFPVKKNSFKIMFLNF